VLALALLAERHRRAGWVLLVRCPEAFIFFAPKSLRAGSYFVPELAKEIGQSTAFVILIGEKGVGRWQVIEYYEAFGPCL
jgi:hypothetical protein